jgi:hypothetical protein
MTQELALGTGQPFGIGRVLGISFDVFRRNVGVFLGATFTISAAYIALQTWVDYQATHGSAEHSFQGGIGIVQTITFTLVQAALTYGVLQDLRGGRPTVGECFSKGLKLSSRLIWAGVLFSLIILVALVALIVPGLVLFTMWWVYVPVIVVEGETITGSFARSRALTVGHRWGILGLSLLVFVLLVVATVGVAALMSVFAGEFVAEVCATLGAVFGTACSGVVTAVGYYMLRVEKEGVDIEAIAQVFG